jgi:hypothetical protein
MDVFWSGRDLLSGRDISCPCFDALAQPLRRTLIGVAMADA